MPRWLALLLLTLSPWAWAQSPDCAPPLDHTVRKLHSSDSLDLCSLSRNKLTLVVNTASQCGYTPQFKGLEALYQQYRDLGLVIIGFPSDDFRQELDSEAATAKLCYINYGVTFPMAATSAVTGKTANPVFQALAKAAGAPGWNFNKYLVPADGGPILHFPAKMPPRHSALEDAIRAALDR